MTRFRATKDFFSKETQSQYTRGLKYTIRNEKLLILAQKWAQEGKVQMLSGATSSVLSGRGQTKRKTLFERVRSWIFNPDSWLK